VLKPACLPVEYAIDVRTPAAYKQPVVLIETSVFTRLVTKTLSDEDYGTLQQWLVDNPDAGDLVRGGAGMRKVRWALPSRGKSGGIRVLYYWRVSAEQIYLLCSPKESGPILRPNRCESWPDT
jgi:hypothetical protein